MLEDGPNDVMAFGHITRRLHENVGRVGHAAILSFEFIIVGHVEEIDTSDIEEVGHITRVLRAGQLVLLVRPDVTRNDVAVKPKPAVIYWNARSGC